MRACSTRCAACRATRSSRPNRAPLAYADRALPIGGGQTISQPYMVAVMTEALELQPADRVLEVGTGSGYQAAILGDLAGRCDDDRAARRTRRRRARDALVVRL